MKGTGITTPVPLHLALNCLTLTITVFTLIPVLTQWDISLYPLLEPLLHVSDVTTPRPPRTKPNPKRSSRSWRRNRAVTIRTSKRLASLWGQSLTLSARSHWPRAVPTPFLQCSATSPPPSPLRLVEEG
uniref:Uncharacterized protein n=1 Tax=Cacopsylla melanoneura TaxID=428564 RepID=A0A8D8Q887_9HEMI